MSSRLNPEADYEGAAARFRDRRRTELCDFLDSGFAAELRRELLDQQDWNLVFRDNGRHYDLGPNQWRALTGEMQGQLRERILAVGRLEFQYNYYNIPMYDMAAAGMPLPPALQRLHQLLQADDFVAGMRRVIGDARVRFADCQATRFDCGHFLSTHDDEVAGKNRLAAYVLSLNPDWRPDWGGILGFASTAGEPGQFICPAYNRLHLFAVPQPHFVGMVTPLAPYPRLSITGWLRS